jgi:nucleotide-binding universal stress UspA family protein
MTKPIIVAVDPRHEDDAPAALGRLFARLLRAPLVLAGAYPVDLPVDSMFPEYARSIEHETEWALERVAERLHEPGVTIRTTALPVSGSPARVLQGLAEREEAQLLVIGSSARGAVGRAMPSAVTDRLLHGAPCPVAVAPPGDAEPDALCVVGAAFTDTPDGHAALEFAEAVASAADARVRVLSVAEPAEPVIAGTLDVLALDSVRSARDEGARIAVARGIEALPAHLRAGGESLSGDAPDALAAASRELDLLVCGSRGYGPVRTVLVGGTSHALVRKAACPVVVVPRSAGNGGSLRRPSAASLQA